MVLFVSGVDWRPFSFVSSQFFRLFLFFGAKVVDKLGVRRFIRKELREEGRKEEKWVSVAAIHDLWREEEEEEDGRMKRSDHSSPLIYSLPSTSEEYTDLRFEREPKCEWHCTHRSHSMWNVHYSLAYGMNGWCMDAARSIIISWLTWLLTG